MKYLLFLITPREFSLIFQKKITQIIDEIEQYLLKPSYRKRNLKKLAQINLHAPMNLMLTINQYYLNIYT